MRVLITGAGEIGRRVIADLSRDSSVELVVVDVSDGLCEELAATYDALVIAGDATDPQVLEQAQIDEADALVATTGSDAVNTVIAILAHRRGVGRVIVKLLSPDLQRALEELGAHAVILPTLAAAASIEAALHGERQTELSWLTAGKLQVVQLPIGDEADGASIAELGLPVDVAPVAILGDGSARVATQVGRVREGDVLLAVVEGEEEAERLERSFERDAGPTQR